MKLSEMQKNDAQQSAQKQKSINEAYQELQGCSADELMQRLGKEIQSQKENGVFDYEALRNSIEKIKSYLPAQTYQNMIRIIDNFK